MGEKPHGSKVKLLEWLGGAEQYWNDGSTASRAAAVLGLRRRGVPVRIGRGGEVGELRGAKAELLAGLIWGR